jgi:LPS-assembly protein
VNSYFSLFPQAFSESRVRGLFGALFVSGVSFVAFLLPMAVSIWPTDSFAQPNNNLVVFSEDDPANKAADQILTRQAVRPTAIPTVAQGLDFQAPQIEFRKEANEIVGKGGVVISENGVQVQANEGVFNTKTKQGDVQGNVLMTTSAGVLAADKAVLNVESETGDFSGLEFDVEEGGYRVESEQARKVSEFEFELLDTDMTTCRCPDGDKPWEISSSRCHLTKEGYAHAYGSTVYFEGLPVLYSPYLVFPVKNERASGLLPAQVGANSRDGFQYVQPIFLSLDESTGMTLTPFLSAKSRIGSELTFEKVFSEKSQLDAGFLYSNESRRKGELRGLVVDGIDDPSVDTNRFGGFWRQRWLSDLEDPTPVEFIADGRYTSDNVFLREIPEANIGSQQAQFLTSTALVRGTAFDFLNLEGRTEYNQMLITPQDLVFQRVPELAAAATETFRPFGQNALGAKLVTSADVVATDFVRQDGYDGWRVNLHPKVTLPFHIQNYLRAAASAELHQTEYSLRDTMLPSTATPLPDGSTELDSEASRTVPVFNYGMSTAVEKVYDVGRDSWFSKLVGLGAYHEGQELTRLKHTFEPLVQYSYVPNVDQNELPLFDQLDRFRERSLVTYGVASRLYGRFFEPYERTREIEELTAADETIPMFDMNQSLLDFGRGMVLAPERAIDTREGEIRELGLFQVRQGYDWVEARKDLDPNTDGLTDVNIGLVLSPSYYFSGAFDSNVNTDSGDFSSYNISLALRDDRDDVLRARYAFVDGRISQVEGNFELKLTEQLRAGAYGLYDTNTDEFLQSQGLLRFQNSCKCWSLDFGVGKRINPDRTQMMFTFTFGGVGSLRQGVGMSND